MRNIGDKIRLGPLQFTYLRYIVEYCNQTFLSLFFLSKKSRAYLKNTFNRRDHFKFDLSSSLCFLFFFYFKYFFKSFIYQCQLSGGVKDNNTLHHAVQHSLELPASFFLFDFIDHRIIVNFYTHFCTKIFPIFSLSLSRYFNPAKNGFTVSLSFCIVSASFGSTAAQSNSSGAFPDLFPSDKVYT